MSHVHEQGDSTKIDVPGWDTWASQVDRTNLEQKIRSLQIEKKLLETDTQLLRKHARKLKDWGRTAVATRKALQVENKELWAGKFSADAGNRALREEIEKLQVEKRTLVYEKDCLQGYFDQLEDEKRAAEDDRSLLREDLEAKILLVEDDKKVLRRNLQRAQSNEARLREQVHTLLAKEVSMNFKENALQQKIQDLESGNAFLSARLATVEDDLQPNVRKFLDAKDELQRVIREFEAKKQGNLEPGLEQPAGDDHADQDPPAQLLSPPESEHSDSESWTICNSSESEFE